MNTLDEISFVVLSQESSEVEQMMYQIYNTKGDDRNIIAIGLLPIFSSVANGWISILNMKNFESEMDIPFDKLISAIRVSYKLYSDKKVNKLIKQIQNNNANFTDILTSDYNNLQKNFIDLFGQEDFGVFYLKNIAYCNTNQSLTYLNNILDIENNNNIISLENKASILLRDYSECLYKFIFSINKEYDIQTNKFLDCHILEQEHSYFDFFIFDNKRKNILGGKLPTSTQLFLFNIYCQNNLFNYAIPYIFHSHNKLYYRSKIQSYLVSINGLNKVQNKYKDLLKFEYLEEINYLNHEKELYFTFENRLRNNIFHYQIENTPIDAFSDKNRFFEEMIEYHTGMKFDKFIEKIDNYLIQINSLICSIIEYDTK